ncbi:Serine/threonine-protein kinase [Cytospora paraplurivora]|uniref:non-specific serine/threonine protein kinase n=1 Tax=Cytospora paraplurivora TaxID=2898453 RepID=A0AAN9TX86_9PEZI
MACHKEEFDVQLGRSPSQPPWAGRSYQPYHPRYLPYAILRYDHSDAFAGAIAGTVESPEWAGNAILWKFDVSRASELTAHIYLKTPDTHQGDDDTCLGMRKQCFSADASRLYSAELFCALDHLHGLGIAYDGLKPWNILLHSSGHIAIGDPRLFISEKQDTRAATGPTRYSAPEALLGRGYSKLSDWWTLGILLYEMLTGLPPFYDDSADETRRKILSDSEPLQLPDSLALSSKDILTRLLDRDPERRLGARGAFEIRDHPFFSGIDWDKLARREYDTPFKPRNISTVFKEHRPPPKSEMLKQFIGFKYKRPDGGIQPEFVTRTQKPIPEKASNSTRVMPSKDSNITAPTSLSDAADTPQPSEAPQAAFGEKPDLELLWKEGTQAFIIRDRVTHVTRPIEARSTYRTPKPVSEANRPSSPDTALEENCAAHKTPTRNVPTQAQKEDVLEAALKAGYLQVVDQLLKNYSGMDLNIRILHTWYTPLQWATEQENLGLVRLFLDHGADPNSHDPAPRDHALLRAVRKNNRELVEALVYRTNRVFRTAALGLAIDKQDAGTATFLLANGARCDFEEGDRPAPAGPYEGCYFEDISYPDDFIPPLARAVKSGDAGLVRLLLAYGADPDAGFHGMVPLAPPGAALFPVRPEDEYSRPTTGCGRVVQLAMDLGHLDIVRLLIASGADISLEQPVWRLHECEMVPRDVYFKVIAGLRAEAAAMKR